jgi:hypothetical protein
VSSCVTFVFFILSDSPASEIFFADVSDHSVSSIFIGRVKKNNWIYEDGTECSETSARQIQAPGNHPKARIQHPQQGESFESSCIITGCLIADSLVQYKIIERRKFCLREVTFIYCNAMLNC